MTEYTEAKKKRRRLIENYRARRMRWARNAWGVIYHDWKPKRKVTVNEYWEFISWVKQFGLKRIPQRYQDH